MEELLVIEVCAGSARLTKTCRKLGLRGLAVDKVTERSCGIDIMVLDLTVASQLQLLLDIIEAEKHRNFDDFHCTSLRDSQQSQG